MSAITITAYALVELIIVLISKGEYRYINQFFRHVKSSTIMATHEILIIGGSVSGNGIAHTLLKKSLPNATSKTSINYHVTILSTTTDFYWNIASPRALINTKLMPTEKIFKSTTENFKKYGNKFTFIHGAAQSVNLEEKSISVQQYQGEDNRPTTKTTLKYDSLILASGTRTNDQVWRPGPGSKADQISRLNLYRTALPSAKSIMLGGNGPVGVETSGEIGYEFKGKEITLISATDHVLPGLRSDIGKFAERNYLKI